MGEDEKASLKVLGEGPGEVFSDPGRHIVLSVGWKPPGWLAALILNTKDISKNMRINLLKALQPCGCREKELLSTEVGGKKAEGLAYEYESRGIRMLGRSCVVKSGKMLYFFHFYVRKELEAESLPVCDAILASARWLQR